MASSSEANPDEKKKEQDLLLKLKCLECPFTWHLPDISMSTERTLRLSERNQYFSTLSSCSVRCFEYAKLGRLECALKAVQEWNFEASLNEVVECDDVDDMKATGDKKELEERELKKTENEDTREAYYHVIFSCKCFVLFQLGRFEEIVETLSKIICFEDMSCEEQTMLIELKCFCFELYGLIGLKPAIGIVENALKLFPDSRRLHFLLGRLLGKVRRIEDRFAAPSMSEIKAFENALRESYSHCAAVNLAGLYREFSRSLWISTKKHELEKETLERIECLNKKAYDMFCKVYADPERGYRQTMRCAEAFTRFPDPWQDLEKAQVCLKEALAVCEEDPYLNHIAGTYCTKTGDLKEAMDHLMLASNGLTTNYGACVDLIVIKQSEDSQYCPVPDLELLLKHIHDEPHVEDILCNLGVVTYLEMNDFKKAFGYWSQVIEKNIDSKKLKYFICRHIRPPRTSFININRKVIENIQERERKGICSERERAILNKLLTLYPNLRESRGSKEVFLRPKGHWARRGEAGDRPWRREDSGLHQSSASSSWRRSGKEENSKSFARSQTTSFNRREACSDQGNSEGSWRSNFKCSTVESDGVFKGNNDALVRKSSTPSE